MEFSFKKTKISRDVKRAEFFLFKASSFLYQLFLFLLILSFALFAASLAGFVSVFFAIKAILLSLAFCLLFWNLYLFFILKINKPEDFSDIFEAVSNPEKYNLAEFLSLDSARFCMEALKFCKKRKIKTDSTVLFYFSVKESKEIAIISFRLGLDINKLRSDLKNCIEKNENGTGFTDDFINTIKDALLLANFRGHPRIGEKEILVGLAKNNNFFKKLLMDFDLKQADIENLTLWLDSAEQAIAKSKQFWNKENLARAGSFGKDWTSGYVVTLDQFSIDWRRVVSKWVFREIIGHKKEIEDTEMILAKSNFSNALIVGEPGTGRKSIVQALAQKCYLGTSLPELNNKRVVELDLVSLTARAQDFEALEDALDRIFQEAAAAGNIILVIDNLENFVGQKMQKVGTVDISGILSKYLAIPNFQFVAITTYAGLHDNIQKNPSFADFFRKVEVLEITEEETIRILQNAALAIEQKNKITVLYPSVREIVNLTSRYMPSLPFPKKALDILDETAVYVETLKEKAVLPHHVAEIISKKTEIPVGKMDVKEKETLLNLENLIHQKIVNQSEAVKEVSIAMRRARAGIGPKKRPMGSFLFLGPTGVGKTETSKALAEIYFGNVEKMIRLDMSEFQAISDIARLIGATSPVEMQGLLTTPVRESPFSLVLMDEIEKAHPDILNLFLQVLDEGHITDGHGRKVVFTNTIIICTSNAGAGMIFKQVEAGQKLDKDKIFDALFEKNIFKPEFINRFDATVLFWPLSKENLLQIAGLMLGSLKKNLKEKEIEFEITEPLKAKIMSLSYKPEFGAREMRRVIQDNVENAIAQALLSEKIKKGDKIEIAPETFEVLLCDRP
ncbi:MAG: hypothetical protein A2402_02055 [Candidatus Staskawiczbacteria bacterium RIFOXYC1_FULL_37_43]|nr:MAG: hypothetical protein A2813_02215 [Candidatus Staskawiczbacteria bacterium RIFCSPHIGHO2_01_FULL_37_17]OGZ71270.1 MAG: hypothetical protein A2891_03340 [Candidatus Staskawiczbacteria bacterium RIFCSPLOWO2_01_FULL_37_19]OGZ75590.1 MAG: hypothetical protein A2205_00135 [Candidatus Staskawiczbacteria bacterium RIFOXYA1_FULL_37_15]OGZ77694.1 MAG: hypothetical protein A2280_03130 [Candidatus Staskawiczbacteria bacterium RIFOXYA12_FULL_37_10]OGZ79866.1 MAG: hypothetical protein A2353_01375 [Can